MPPEPCPLEVRRRYVLDALGRYWPAGPEAVAGLAIPQVGVPDAEPLPPRFEAVGLPPWAEEVGVGGRLLIPSRFVLPGGGPPWARTDWLGATFWFLNGLAERALESRRGPIHSYAYRLKGWPPEAWERAWVNRIALFLRRWAARDRQADEVQLLGPLPEPEILVTHDVDAIAKTLAIRTKQAAFHAFRAGRALGGGRPRHAIATLGQAARFLLSRGDYWAFDRIAALEERCGIRSHFYVYGAGGGWRRGPRQLLLDPAYDVAAPRLSGKIRELRARGWTIGVHLSCSSWRDPVAMGRERARVQEALGAPVVHCRQHWLGFSWEQTWAAQEEAGLCADATLGFNDRPAFRNSAALAFRPWDPRNERPMGLTALPMVAMDSHFYDYQECSEAERQEQMRRWVDEIRAVRGVATVIWHQRVLSPDYGWQPAFEALLSMIAGPRRGTSSF